MPRTKKADYKEQESQSGRRMFIVTLIEDVFRFILWAFVVSLFIVRYPPVSLPPFVRLLGILSLALVLFIVVRILLRTLGFGKVSKWCMTAVWRFGIFPIRVCGYLVAGFGVLVTKSMNVLSFPRRIEVFIVPLGLLVAAMRTAVSTDSSLYLILSMVVLGICLIIAWLALYSWTRDPCGFWDRLMNAALKWWKCRARGPQQGKKNSGAESSTPQFIKSNLQGFHNAAKWSGRILARFDDRMYLLSRFLALFVFIVLLTIVVFAFEYYALEKLHPSSFSGVSGDIWEFMYFSAITFTTLNSQGQHPVTPPAKILVLVEVFATIFLLVVAVLAFSSVTLESAKTFVRRGRRKMLALQKEIEKLMTNSQN